MNIENIAKEIQKWVESESCNACEHCSDSIVVGSDALVNFIAELFAKKQKKLEGCVVVPEWISTKESLPAEGVEVLVHRYGQVIQATKDSGYAGGFKERNCYGWQATFDVTYWMPKNFKLPDSYSLYYNNEHPYKETMVEAARGGNHE